ncbi:DUF4013 domain-containing protein [Methanobrevibacter sp.]|uniref:DUF4013 domain-containing protein n=1 Tax=Methanobrevibacter sp. TaxID=66852 RepID=UPI0025F1094E|nr:DUF4013 domain-containing protein [Methanobrevibacter sp.]MBQ6099964.1 DUF4013 domain-containing protein [Methanobrevibacter sp.]MBQ6512690.1 DUF4013 domain-containing protein [Methanobrevibacter sp.]
MASITDHVKEGLKYPFNDIKKLLGLGGLFALISAISVFMSVKSFEIFRFGIHMVENTNGNVSHIPFSQLPTGDIYLVVALAIVSFIISLFIFGYQYNIVKFSIDKKEDLPGFNDIIGMLVNGIKYFIVVLAYNIIPIIIMACGIVLIGNSSALAIIILISVLLFIISYFLLIMALNNMVAHDSITKAFDIKEITGNISNLGWGKYVGIIIFTIIVYMIIMAAASFILSMITGVFIAAISNQALIISIFVAVIEGLFIDSYGAIFYNRVCGSVYRESIK